MPGKLPILRAKEVVRALERAGFYIHHQTGSHARLFHSKDIPVGLVKRILKQAQLTEEEFIKFL